MPTILRTDGFTVRVLGPPREHPPPHVHVQKGREALVVIRLRTADRPQQVWAVHDMTNAGVVRAFRIVEAHHDRLLRAWEELHGTS